MRVADLLQTPVGRDLRALVSPARSPQIVRTVLAEDLESLGQCPEGSLVVVPQKIAERLSGLPGDVQLRAMGQRAVAGLILIGVRQLPVTALRLAERGDITLLAAPADQDLPDLLVGVAHEIEGGTGAAFARAASMAAAADVDGVTADDLVAEAERTLGCSVRLGAPDDPGIAVWLDGRIHSTVAADRTDPVAELVLRLLADGLSRVIAGERRSQLLPDLSRGELLADIVRSSPGRETSLVERARDLGMPVDGWHLAVRVEAGPLSDLLAAHDRIVELTAMAQRSLQAVEPGWRVAPFDTGLLLIRSASREPRADQHGSRTVVALLESLAQAGQRGLRAGVGGVHPFVGGLRVSAAEAGAALASGADSGAAVVTFDAVGVRRMLVEWLTADTARQTVRDLLAPLHQLEPERAHDLTLTLHTFLDEQGSYVKAAARLHLHRNGVVQRIHRLQELLGTDLSDPDERLMLALACRARLLGPTPSS